MKKVVLKNEMDETARILLIEKTKDMQETMEGRRKLEEHWTGFVNDFNIWNALETSSKPISIVLSQSHHLSKPSFIQPLPYSSILLSGRI